MEISTNLVLADLKLTPIGPDENWTKDQLLTHQGLFLLEEAARALDFPAANIKKLFWDCEQNEGTGSAWLKYGVTRVDGLWLVHMPLFRAQYETVWAKQVREVSEHWDGNQLLSQSGVFYLAEVVRRIPFSAHQLRYRARSLENPKVEMGVWKDSGEGCYLVEMSVFSVWLKAIWTNWNMPEGF